MFDEEVALLVLRADGECPEAEDRIRRLLVDLERSGVPPRLIAAAQARILLGFCAEHARTVENSGWVWGLLAAVSGLLHVRSKAGRRHWVTRFLRQAHLLYEDARREVRADMVPPPLPPFALEASKPQGSA